MKRNKITLRSMLPITLLMVFLMSCGGSQPIPDWTYASFNQMEDFKKAYLEGKAELADLHFQHAVEEIKKSGDLNLLAKAYLNRYAVQVALLESFRDDDFLKIQLVEPDPVNAGFYALLKGNFSQADSNLLPPQYARTVTDILAARREGLVADVQKIEDPLSRLVMTGLLALRYGYESEELLNGAVETASRQGWKKALLVYLNRLQVYYEQRQEGEKASKIKQRILLIQ